MPSPFPPYPFPAYTEKPELVTWVARDCCRREPADRAIDWLSPAKFMRRKIQRSIADVYLDSNQIDPITNFDSIADRGW